MNCLIIDASHPSLLPLLEEAGISYDYCPDINEKEVLQRVKDYEILIVRSKMKINNTLYDAAPKLKIIARAGAGVDQIDDAELEKRGITLLNAPEGNRDAVGEHTLGMILCLFNRINLADIEVREKRWLREENRGVELFGKTVGIIGYGNMGQATAKRFAGFGCEVLAYDKYRENYSDTYAEETTLEGIFQKVDVLCVHIPLWEENRFWMNEAFFSQFNKGIYFINMARGEIIKLSDVKVAMEKGYILGAALDVLENEKLHTLNNLQQDAFDYLIKKENVLFTPHIGGWTHESYDRINRVLMEKIGNCKVKKGIS